MSSDLEKSDLFFVYGTLKEGRGNNVVLGDSEFLGVAETEGKFLMVSSGIPFVFPADKAGEENKDFLKPISGHLFKVTDPLVLRGLDHLEGHPSFYTRTLVKLAGGERAWMYLILNDTVNGYLQYMNLYLCRLNSKGCYEY